MEALDSSRVGTPNLSTFEMCDQAGTEADEHHGDRGVDERGQLCVNVLLLGGVVCCGDIEWATAHNDPIEAGKWSDGGGFRIQHAVSKFLWCEAGCVKKILVFGRSNVRTVSWRHQEKRNHTEQSSRYGISTRKSQLAAIIADRIFHKIQHLSQIFR